MPECPRCLKKIDHLLRFSPAEYRFIEDADGLHIEDTYALDGPDQWECPECNAVLFDQKTADDAEILAHLFVSGHIDHHMECTFSLPCSVSETCPDANGGTKLCERCLCVSCIHGKCGPSKA